MTTSHQKREFKMNFKSLEIITSIREEINKAKALPFPYYKLVKRNIILNYIDKLYACLPEDVQNARKYLKEHNYDLEKLNKKQEHIHDILKNFENYLDNTITFLHIFIVVNAKEFEEMLNKIKDNLPEEILKAQILDK